MRAILSRNETGEQGTFGTLKLEGGFVCATAELPWNNNAPDISCIPPGHYICKRRWSWHFMARLYEIQGVQGRMDILLHKGNFAGDNSKGWKTDVQGCILTGKDITTMTPEGYHRAQKAITNSKVTLAEFMKAAKGEDLELTIFDFTA